MKETNMEHYRCEIEAIMKDFEGFGVDIDNSKLIACSESRSCERCKFSYLNNKNKEDPCAKHKIKWLMSEYKPEPVLTEREKHFVEAINNGFIARDKNNNLGWYSVKPLRRIDVSIWKNNRRSFSISISRTEIFANNMFPFITWEDEEPWSVADLRKLKVGDQDA